MKFIIQLDIFLGCKCFDEYIRIMLGYYLFRTIQDIRFHTSDIDFYNRDCD